MVERLAPNDVRLTPEYWGGHGAEDPCAWNVVGVAVDTSINQVWDEIQREKAELRKLVGEELERFRLLKASGFVPITKCEDTFDPNAFPHGTFIRQTSEALNLHGEVAYTTAEMFGLVVDPRDTSVDLADKGNVVLYIDPVLIVGLPAPIKIGQVQHTRTRYLHSVDESLDRVTGVDIILMGRGSRKKAPSPKLSFPSWLPRLGSNPQRA